MAASTIAAVASVIAVGTLGLVPALAAIAIVIGAWLVAMALEPVAAPEIDGR